MILLDPSGDLVFCLINSKPSSNSTQVIEALLPSKKWHTEACS